MTHEGLQLPMALAMALTSNGDGKRRDYSEWQAWPILRYGDGRHASRTSCNYGWMPKACELDVRLNTALRHSCAERSLIKTFFHSCCLAA